MEDDLVCEYDSTWDTESDGDDPGESQTRRSSQDKTKSWGLWSTTSSRNIRAAKDMQNYRRGYPNLTDDECPEDRMMNLKFYLNEYASSPDDVYIESFHKEWKTDYKRLERVHSYIQWLFPLREPGVNYMASELTKKEIQAFRDSDEAKKRLVESYELMLGFYGIQLVNKDTGEVKRADNWRERFANLERNMHNNLRITRILKSLGELGFEHYQAPLVRFFLEETLVKKTLSSMKRSVLDYFLFAVRDKRKRKDLLRFAYQHYEPKDKFVWCPRKVQKQLKKKPESVGNGDGSEEGRSRAKGKDGEAGAPQKDEKDEKDAEDLTETPKSTEEAVSGDGDKQTEGSSVDPEAESSSTDQELTNSNSNDNTEMEHSGSPKPEKSEKVDQIMEEELKDGSQSKDSVQEVAKAKQTTSGTGSEKPQKKKREGDKEMPSNGPAGGLSNGREVPDNNQSGQASLSVKESEGSTQASTEGSTEASAEGSAKPLSEDSSKDSPSCSSERGEKHRRTDFSIVLDKNEGAEMVHTASAGESTEKHGDDQANGTNPKSDVEAMDVESAPANLDQDMGNS